MQNSEAPNQFTCTVKDLRALIDGLPDDGFVYVNAPAGTDVADIFVDYYPPEQDLDVDDTPSTTSHTIDVYTV